jgi:acyl carrier protein
VQQSEITKLIIECLQGVHAEDGIPAADVSMGPDTVLLGKSAVLDSLGLVRLVLEVEQRIADTFDWSVSLADERAMSQHRSPFRTVGSLAEYITTLAGEAGK